MAHTSLFTLGSAAFGSGLQEIVYWYNLRHSLDEDVYHKLVRSRGYWLAVAAMVAAAGVAALIWFDNEWPKPRDALVFGASVPLFIKQLGRAGATRVTFGPDRFAFFKSYFAGT